MTWNRHPKPVVRVYEPGEGMAGGDHLIHIEINLNGIKFVKNSTVSAGGSWSRGEINAVLLDQLQLKTAEILEDIQYAAEQGKIPPPDLDPDVTAFLASHPEAP